MKSLAELSELKNGLHPEVAIRAGEAAASGKYEVLVCGVAGCLSSGAVNIQERIVEKCKEMGIADKVKVVPTGCFGLCAEGPILVVYPGGNMYTKVKVEDVDEIVEEDIINGKAVERLLLVNETGGLDADGNVMKDVDFFGRQKRVVLANLGLIDPDKIEDYIAFDGYQALGKVLTTMTPQEVVEEVKKSGLRGRGGAGFSTGMKWSYGAASPGEIKYILCNADEGDPGAFMDRSVLEGDPHAIVEAMAIAGYAIGAHQGFIYVRAEYPAAVARLYLAISQAKEYGFLGENIFGSGFDFDLELRLGAGAFVCGEATALMNSVEGKRGEPRPRPPFPAAKGLWEKPSVLNNVETFASVPRIILNGADWYKSMGTPTSAGTKVFALAGKVYNTGLVEVEMGTTLREIIYNIGGGIPGGKKFKAAQTGGPSGGCISTEHLDTPIDYESLAAIGSMMGSGGMIVMDEDNCMVDIARFFLEFTCDESCGKCPPCRIGTKRMLEILTRITEGKGEMEDINKLENLAKNIQASALCGLGQTCPNPILSTLRYFKDEYLAHVTDKKCPAGVCKNLLSYKIDPAKCTGCTLCARICPASAITGSVKQPHIIDDDKCIKCGACIETCKFGAISTQA